MAFLKVFSNGEERTVFLGDEPVLIGRGDEVDCLLKDHKVSRQHCVIEPIGEGRWRVRDLGSGNGTKVNGERIDVFDLEPDDAVEVGDAKILFAGEAVAVVAEPALEPRPKREERPARRESESPPSREPNRRARAARQPSRTPYVIAAFLLIALASLAVFWPRERGGHREDLAESAAYANLQRVEGDTARIDAAQEYLLRFPTSRRALNVEGILAAARRRVEQGGSLGPGGFDPSSLVQGLSNREAISRLEELLESESADRRPAIEAALADYRRRAEAAQERFFSSLEGAFAGLVAEGQYSRAREIWFFLRGEEAWAEMPEVYSRRIVDRMSELENAAARDRSELFAELTRLEAGHEFEKARQTLEAARPRFAGTSVLRSLDERLEFVRTALRTGVTGSPRTVTPATPVEVDLERRSQALLAQLGSREFARIAAELRTLVARAKDMPAYAALDARARECEAAAALHTALVAELKARRLPRKRIAGQWRVTGGDQAQLEVKTKTGEQAWTWAEVPGELYFDLHRAAAGRKSGGPLGLAVMAHAISGPEQVAVALELGYGDERLRPVLDVFVAARIRREPLPQGGYIVDAGDILTRKEYLRRTEEKLIARFKAELNDAYKTVLDHKAFKRLARFKEKKERLDEARNFALKLIFDTKKYFYPYRGTGRMGEYNKVQQEVDRRVDAVRELWDDRATLSVKSDGKLDKTLKAFDTAAVELTKRLVDVDDRVYEVGFLRSYLGRKFDVRSFFRSAEERDLLAYTVEVMEFNPAVKGDITDAEREQVRVTNEYRIMFGRQPVRIQEKLVLSSRGHCEEMSRLNYFGHFSPTEGRRTPYDRMKLAGYTYGASENCAAGSTSPAGVHAQWCHSSGHHRNLLMEPWTEMGSGQFGRLWTQNFGRAPKWSKHDARREQERKRLGGEDVPGWAPWEEDDEGEDGETELEEGDSDPSKEEEDGYDYGD